MDELFAAEWLEPLEAAPGAKFGARINPPTNEVLCAYQRRAAADSRDTDCRLVILEESMLPDIARGGDSLMGVQQLIINPDKETLIFKVKKEHVRVHNLNGLQRHVLISRRNYIRHAAEQGVLDLTFETVSPVRNRETVAHVQSFDDLNPDLAKSLAEKLRSFAHT